MKETWKTRCAPNGAGPWPAAASHTAWAEKRDGLGGRATRAVFIIALLWIALAAAPLGAVSPCSAGRIRVLRLANSAFDSFTSHPNSGSESWLRSHLWRMVVFSPYFDKKLGWFPAGDFYKDLYSIDPNGPVAAEHPDWILRNARGDPLYIPWNCSGGTCPQYAGDIANPAFRQGWIDDARQSFRRGYPGLFVDDVNMEFRVSDGYGNFVVPIDTTTGAPMNYTAWRGYVARFTAEIRAAFPGAEIIHNSIWFAGPPGVRDRDPSIVRQIASADYQYIEHGVNDRGLTGDNGQWSLQALLGYIDRVHAAGHGVILGGVPADPAGAEYASAAYLLIAEGSDAIASDAVTPDNWWPGFDADLGAPLGPRRLWQGLLRRDYSGGMALLNPPRSATVSVALPETYRRVDGSTVSWVTLQASQGAVLLAATPAPLPAACQKLVRLPMFRPAQPLWHFRLRASR